ncbi:MAG: DeoR/GlpR family DNA-binding transcription regulator [Anaerococcus vaginalis]|nr:DeoR/GlpR family DNA-binding transcription regulator [Anaerococcus vaginalis]
MLREERQNYIVNKVNENGIIRISDIKKELDVSEMTIRRDLNDLENKSLLERVHGGAKSIRKKINKELSHLEKTQKNYKDKLKIAKKVSMLIEDEDIVFIGAGSTLELCANFFEGKNCKIVTNSLFLFNRLVENNNRNIESILVGGSFRKITGAFVGNFAINTIKVLHFKKAFIGTNGVKDSKIYTHNILEGDLQARVLNNSTYKYIVSDSSKLGREDFFDFYNLEKIDSIIIDNNASKKDLEIIKNYTKVIKAV